MDTGPRMAHTRSKMAYKDMRCRKEPFQGVLGTQSTRRPYTRVDPDDRVEVVVGYANTSNVRQISSGVTRSKVESRGIASVIENRAKRRTVPRSRPCEYFESRERQGQGEFETMRVRVSARTSESDEN